MYRAYVSRPGQAIHFDALFDIIFICTGKIARNRFLYIQVL